MKKKLTGRDNVNLFFSAFLILAYIICGYFFAGFANSLTGEVERNVILAAIVAVFGLLVFYATRVGEGKTVKRFSIITLILLDLPALCIVLAFIIPAFPFHEQLATEPAMVAYMAAAALGYGIPYTFISGFETVSEDDAQTEDKEETEALEGGIEEELSETEPEEPTYEPETDEIVVEGTAVIENLEVLDGDEEE